MNVRFDRFHDIASINEQPGRIIGIFVSRNDLIRPLPDQCHHVVRNITLIPIIRDARRHIGRQSKTVIETYFNESVQGLDIGSKVKYRGVSVGEVTRIGFTYNKYELDKTMSERKRYVLVEATILGRLIGSRAGGDITRPEQVRMEIEKGLRIRLAPQGITGTNYLEIDYVDPKANPELPISWEPADLYIPSSPSTFTQFVAAAGDVVEKLQHIDIDATLQRLNRLLDNTNRKL